MGCEKFCSEDVQHSDSGAAVDVGVLGLKPMTLESLYIGDIDRSVFFLFLALPRDGESTGIGDVIQE